MTTYITFGQTHVHTLNGVTFDKDCVAVVDAPEHEARELFQPKFCFSYTDKEKIDISYFPRGFINVGGARGRLPLSLPRLPNPR